jgi:hypothetical protein
MFRVMNTGMLRVMSLLLAALGVFAGQCARCESPDQDFRVENRVYSGDSTTPASQSCTIFYQGAVYDFLEKPAETVIFDKTAARFFILDDGRRVRTELSTARLDSFAQQLHDRALKGSDALMRFFAEPAFDQRFDATRRELILCSDLVTYKVIAVSAENAALAAQYREFSDWYARLNAMLVPGSRPPFARLKLNEALAEREAVARKVTLTITTVKNGKRQTASMRSEHLLSPALLPADMERIERARQAVTAYKLVTFDKYRQGN